MQGTGRTPALVAVALTAVLTSQVSCRSADGPAEGATGDPCPTPDVSAVRQDAARSALVARVEPIGRPKISDGVTTSEGLLVRVGEVLAGAPVSGDIAVANGLLVQHGSTISRLCKGNRSGTADAGILDGL